jgi:cysteine sulfinate desulfinase/cysteine desulfurase-like protein
MSKWSGSTPTASARSSYEDLENSLSESAGVKTLASSFMHANNEIGRHVD